MNWLYEYARMCHEYKQGGCDGCPLMAQVRANRDITSCTELIYRCFCSVVDIIDEWRSEPWRKTYEDDLLEKYPKFNRVVEDTGEPDMCRKYFYPDTTPEDCNGDCPACWYESMPPKLTMKKKADDEHD